MKPEMGAWSGSLEERRYSHSAEQDDTMVYRLVGAGADREGKHDLG